MKKRLFSMTLAGVLSLSALHASPPASGTFSTAEAVASPTLSLPESSVIPNGAYTIKNVNSGKYLTQRYGNVMQMGTPQAWKFVRQTDGTYVITYGNDYALTVECGNGTDGNNISLQKANGSDAQKFVLQQVADHTYALLTAVSNGESAVDVYNISTEDGANICQWDYWEGDGQHFVLEAAAVSGDINGDGGCDLADAALLQQWLTVGTGTLSVWQAGDLDGNGLLNAVDLTLLKRLLMQEETDIPLPLQVEVSTHTNPFAGNITDPASRYNYGGDPTAFVEGDTVYAYTGHDISTNAEVGNAIYNIPEYLCYSTKDLINWNYEGVVMKMSDVSWGDAKSAWAGQVIQHSGKYYLYFCSWDRTSEGKQSIGVAVSDSPTGPFREIGHPLVKGTLTNDQSSNWNDIDPTVWVETDESGVEHRYLAWGNSRYYVCELNEDMVSVKDLNGDGRITFAGEGTNGDVFYRGRGLHMFTEAPWIYRRQNEDGSYYGDYYLIYAYGWREQMAYSTCTDLLRGDWTFGNVIFDANATSNTNHSGFFDFKGKTYMIYHNGALPEGNGYRRSPNICEVHFDSNGKIPKMEETTAGIGGTVSQISNQNGALLGHAAFTNSVNDNDYPYTNVALGFGMNGLTEHDTDWVIVPGLSNVGEATYVSIQSENKTGLFVTAGTNGSSTALSQQTTILQDDLKRATFRTIEGLADRTKVTFESVAYPGTYLTCTASGALVLTNGSDPAACTFQITPKN